MASAVKRIFKCLTVVFSILLVCGSGYGQETETDIKVGKTVILDSKILKEKRGVYISVPPGYDKSEEKYPVLFVLDGEGNFIFSSGVMHFLGQTGRMPNMITAGIPNVDRGRDLTPSVVTSYKSGGAERFLDFLEKELIPYLDKNYRTQPFRILFGHSLGAMFNIYCLTTRPDLFKAHIAASPALHFDNNVLLRSSIGKIEKLSDKYRMLYMTVGDEKEYDECVSQFIDILEDEGSDKLLWKYDHMETESHSSIRLKALYQGLEFIYKDWMIDNEDLDGGQEAVFKKFTFLSDKFGYKIEPEEKTLNAIGYIYLRIGRFEESIKTFRMNVELYPDSPNVYDSLGDALEKTNQLELAFENYEKAFTFSKVKQPGGNQTYEKNFLRLKKLLNK